VFGSTEFEINMNMKKVKKQMSDLKSNLIYLFHVGTFLGAQVQALPFPNYTPCPHPTKLNTKCNRCAHTFIDNFNSKNIFFLLILTKVATTWQCKGVEQNIRYRISLQQEITKIYEYRSSKIDTHKNK
jgi:hypothetical protein